MWVLRTKPVFSTNQIIFLTTESSFQSCEQSFKESVLVQCLRDTLAHSKQLMVFNAPGTAKRECAKSQSQERMQTRNRMKELANLSDLHEIQSCQCWLRSRSDENRLETLAGGLVCWISLHSSTFGSISEHIILAAQVSNQEIPAVLGVCSSQCCQWTSLWPLVHWGKESESWRLSRDSLDFDSQRMKIAISKVLSLSKQKIHLQMGE